MSRMATDPMTAPIMAIVDALSEPFPCMCVDEPFPCIPPWNEPTPDEDAGEGGTVGVLPNGDDFVTVIDPPFVGLGIGKV